MPDYFNPRYDNDSNDPRNAKNTLDFQAALGKLQEGHMTSCQGQTYEHLLTKEKKIGAFRRDRKIFFQGEEDCPYDANEWCVSYPEKF